LRLTCSVLRKRITDGVHLPGFLIDIPSDCLFHEPGAGPIDRLSKLVQTVHELIVKANRRHFSQLEYLVHIVFYVYTTRRKHAH